MEIHLLPNFLHVKEHVTYLFKVLGVNKKTNFQIVTSSNDSAPSIGDSPTSTLHLSKAFTTQEFSVDQLKPNGLFELENGTPDYLGSAFFLLTSLQEYNDTDPDLLGRFKYRNSYQFKLKNATQNLVQHCFDKIATLLKLPALSEKSSFYLSHDIDSVYGSIKEDGFNVLKAGRVDKFMSLLFNIASYPEGRLNFK